MKRRSNCPLSCALDLLGDHWILLLIRDLMRKGTCSYGDFINAKEHIASNILSDRLKKLTDSGIVLKEKHPTDGKKFLYSLTEKGEDLGPILKSYVSWSKKYIEDTDEIPQSVTLKEGDPKKGLIS